MLTEPAREKQPGPVPAWSDLIVTASPHSQTPKRGLDARAWQFAVSVQPITVRGGSMAPTLIDGDVVTVHQRQARVGDVVAFMSKAHGLVVHRVVARGFGHLIVRGDACCAVDAPVPLSDVVGVIGDGDMGDVVRALWRLPWGVLRRAMRHASYRWARP